MAQCLTPTCTHETDATDELFCWCCVNIDEDTGSPVLCNECGNEDPSEWASGPNAENTGIQFECQTCGSITHPGCSMPFTPTKPFAPAKE